MAIKEDILCLSSIDWDFIWQGHQEIMSRYAAQGHRVLFVENTGARAPRLKDLSRMRRRWRNWRRGSYGVREERANVFVFSPLVIPLPHSRIATWFNRWILVLILRRWMKAVGFTHPIVWSFLPTRMTLDLLDHIEHRLLIYYCIDRFTASSPTARKIAQAETRLVRRADLVFVTSHALFDYCAPLNAKVHHFPFGVDLSTFDRLRDATVPSDLASLPRPVIGYVGGIHQWLDQPLIQAVAARHPGFSFVLVGPAQTETAALAALPNVHLVGQRTHEELPRYIQAFDVGIIPYRLTEYTRHVYPTKLTEYLALGKPVVSTALPEVECFNREFGPLVRVEPDADGFSRALDEVVTHQDGREAEQRRLAAQANSWETRFQRMTALIAQAIERKWTGQERHWRQTVSALARGARNRTLKVLGPAVAVWLLMFHSPLLSWVARPLHLRDPARPADAIVVFAGGVGESGKAGQGYQERAEKAIRLYRQGMARTVIFSSGYASTFREAEVMQALAVALGVPADRIFLDERAGSTHDNVVLTAELMRHQGLHSALIVSSPYHMRRIDLVWQKQAPDLEARLTPVERSEFYGTLRPIHWRHWQAILHEYLGIVYYWWNGWI